MYRFNVSFLRKYVYVQEPQSEVMAALDDIHAVEIVYVAETSPPSSFHLVENQVVDKGDTIGDRLSRSLNEVKVRGVNQISRKLLIFV